MPTLRLSVNGTPFENRAFVVDGKQLMHFQSVNTAFNFFLA